MSAIPIAQYAPPRHGILAEFFLWLGGLVSQAWSFVRRTVCGMRGHEMVLHFERDRLSLYCLRCGANTPGWSMDGYAGVRPMPPRARVDRRAPRPRAA